MFKFEEMFFFCKALSFYRKNIALQMERNAQIFASLLFHEIRKMKTLVFESLVLFLTFDVEHKTRNDFMPATTYAKVNTISPRRPGRYERLGCCTK
jgi:hypothetical protein